MDFVSRTRLGVLCIRRIDAVIGTFGHCIYGTLYGLRIIMGVYRWERVEFKRESVRGESAWSSEEERTDDVEFCKLLLNSYTR